MRFLTDGMAEVSACHGNVAIPIKFVNDLPLFAAFSVPNRCGGNYTEHPWDVADDIRDHQYVMPVMIISRGDVDPASARESSQKTDAE